MMESAVAVMTDQEKGREGEREEKRKGGKKEGKRRSGIDLYLRSSFSGYAF